MNEYIENPLIDKIKASGRSAFPTADQLGEFNKNVDKMHKAATERDDPNSVIGGTIIGEFDIVDGEYNVPDHLNIEPVASNSDEITTSDLLESTMSDYGGAFNSTKDVVTKDMNFTVECINETHSKALRQLIDSIIKYINNAVPKAAQMEPDEFFDYVCKFYAERLVNIVATTEPEPSECTVKFTQHAFGFAGTTKLIKALTKYYEYPEDNTELKALCIKLAAIVTSRQEEQRSFYRTMNTQLDNMSATDRKIFEDA